MFGLWMGEMGRWRRRAAQVSGGLRAAGPGT